MYPGFSETHKKYIPVGLEGCGLRNLPWDAIYLGLQSKGCCQAPFRVAPGRRCLTGFFHIMFLQTEFYSYEETPATIQARRTTAQIPSKVVPKFHILLWFVLISFYLANISWVLTPWLGPLWRLCTFTLTRCTPCSGQGPLGPEFRSNPPYCTLGLQLAAATHIGADLDCVCGLCLVQA